MKKYFLVFVILLSYEFAISQSLFQKRFDFYGYSGQQTSDGGFIMCGMISDSSFSDACLVKLNSGGDTLWTKRYGGANYDWGTVVRETSDNGFIIFGGSQSFGSGFEDDLYIIKTDMLGNVLWSTAYGDSHYESVFSAQQTTDGGYVLAGNISVGATGQKDVNIVKLDSVGTVIWTKIIGGVNDEYANEIQQTFDGGYIIGGTTNSFGAGNKDALLIKLDSVGILQWTKTYGTVVLEEGNTVQQTVDGGYILAGRINFGGPLNYNMLMVKTDALGSVTWSKKLGSSSKDLIKSIKQTYDNGYIISGSTLISSSNSLDMCLLKLDSVGNMNWAASYGDTSVYNGYSYELQLTSDAGFLLLGQSVFPSLSIDFLDCIKTDEFGNTGCTPNFLSFYDSVISLSVSSPVFSITTGGGAIISSTNVGCGCFADTTFCTAFLSLNELSLNRTVNFYPNPFSTYTTIELNEKYQKGIIKVIDVFGREIEIIPFVGNKIVLERGELKEGIYFIQIISEHSIVACEKIIIQ